MSRAPAHAGGVTQVPEKTFRGCVLVERTPLLSPSAPSRVDARLHARAAEARCGLAICRLAVRDQAYVPDFSMPARS